MTVRCSRSECERLTAALTIKTLLVRTGVVRAEEGYRLDKGLERGDGADDDGDTGFDDRPQDYVGNFDCMDC
jgi:hypothetical protein